MTIALVVICLAITLGWAVTLDRQADRHAEVATSWRIERQQLLDRIQAPSFSEYKQAEVKVIKAQQPQEKEPIPLEPL